VRTIFGELELAVEAGSGSGLQPGPVTVLVRPEQLEVSEQPAADGSGIDGSGADGSVAGRVVACHYYGHDAVLRVRPTDPASAPEIIVRTSGGPQLPPGTAVLLRAKGPVLAWPAA
jgi:TOBE domain